MQSWWEICLLLCTFGFFKELRPSEAYLTQYLLGPHHNLTESEVYFEVYPVWTYSYLGLLVVVFLCTDLLRYKPVIIFEGIGYTITWCLLIWGRGVRSMQLVEFFYGISTSTEVAYYTYIYAVVDSKHFQKVTSYTRSAILTGRFCSSAMAQILLSLGLMDYYELNFISLGSVSLGLLISLTLPPAKKSIYFHRPIEFKKSDNPISVTTETPGSDSTTALSNSQDNNLSSSSKLKFFQAIGLMKLDFIEAYTNVDILKWSIWWAFASSMNFQVGNYIQPLWESRRSSKDTDELYNGVVEAASTLLGALTAFSVGYVKLNWTLIGELILAVMSAILTVCLLAMGLIDSITVAYINYIIFRASYMFLITICSFQVARKLKAESYGLVFGFNMFLALSIQSVLTVIVIEIYEVQPPLQFVIYGCYFGVLAFFFVALATYHFGKLGWSGIKAHGIFQTDGTSDQL